MRDSVNHAPDLIRGLMLLTPRGPGSSPGHGSPVVNQGQAQKQYAPLCLHHGLATRRCSLHGSHPKLAYARRSAPVWPVCPYGKIQNQNPSLVRGTRRFRDVPSTRALAQEMAPRMERCADHPSKPTLARHDTRHSLISVAEGPDQVRGGYRQGETP